MDNLALNQYANLHWAYKEAQAYADLLKKQRDEWGEKLTPQMLEEGVKRTTVHGSTIRVDRMVRASAGGQMSALCAAFREAANDPEVLEAYPLLASMVSETINGNTLSKWVREHDPDNELAPEDIIEKLPEPIRAAIKVTEKWEIHCTKG